ncbi:MAG: tRNA pseudouridine(55) synthase TruB [Gammaproteobacteria bacterium]|nr:tRNA pseudouridine(55) synthase TruB [Gammaproteobacteria bacterium]
MGRRRKNKNLRSINGILLLDKPLGASSNRVLQDVKHLYKAQKAGHTGSLDPLATGLLPICFGEATKVSGFLLEANKSYQFTCRLGETTTTGDSEGDILETRPVNVSERQINKVLKTFVGQIQQIPPMYSALHHEGKRLYELARQGIEVERKARAITIFSLVMLGRDEDDVFLDVKCSKGTYVRSLAEDIGRELGCGAHVASLHRSMIEPYLQPDMVSMESLLALQDLDETQRYTELDDLLLPTESALIQWPDVNLDEDSSFYMRQGQAVQVSGSPADGFVRLFDEKRRFIGMGEIADDGRVAPKRLMSTAEV